MVATIAELTRDVVMGFEKRFCRKLMGEVLGEPVSHSYIESLKYIVFRFVSSL